MRIASFGDSFTHASDVNNEETWQEYLGKDHPQLEVLNFGVPGYGTDQGYLRYLREGRHYHPHIVLIGFMPENIFRHVNVFRPFYGRTTQIPFAKPRFILNQSKLTLLPNPIDKLSRYQELLRHPDSILAELGKHDYYYQRGYEKGLFDILPSVRLLKIARQQLFKQKDIPLDGYYNEESEVFQVAKGIFDEFYHTVIQQDALPIILIFPEREDVYRYWREGTKRYAPLLAYFEERGYPYLDLIHSFERVKEKERFLLVKDTMQQLRSEGIPEDIIEDVKALKHQMFENQEEFVAAIDTILDKEAMQKYGDIIVEIAQIDEARSLIPSHCSPRGNKLIAQYILQYLQEHELLKNLNGTNTVRTSLQ